MTDGQPPAVSPHFEAARSVYAVPVKVQPTVATEIVSKHDSIVSKSEAHFQKHRQLWTNQQFGKLLAGDGARMSLRPYGMVDDRKAHLMRAADHLVRQRQTARINRINRAAENMLSNKKVRSSSNDIRR